MKSIFTFCALAIWVNATAQVIDFEGFDLPVDSFINNAGPEGAFILDENTRFSNNYNPMFDSWDGWAISTDTDNVTPGFFNQYSAFPGSGDDDSETYAVAYSPQSNSLISYDDDSDLFVSTLSITNNTYAYLSMRDGDDFAKKFGGESGDDPDFFLLTIKGYVGGDLTTDSIDFYLADYRFDDNDEDYIISEWTELDISDLWYADSLSFSLSSSDIGQFGMNTPAYFCVDNVMLDIHDSAKEVSLNSADIRLYPNPATEFFILEYDDDADYQRYEIIDQSGRLLRNGQIRKNKARYDIADLPKGYYHINLYQEDRQIAASKRFVKM